MPRPAPRPIVRRFDEEEEEAVGLEVKAAAAVAAVVEEEVRVGLDWVERVVATVDKRVVLEVENVLTFVNLSVAELLMDAAAD